MSNESFERGRVYRVGVEDSMVSELSCWVRLNVLHANSWVGHWGTGRSSRSIAGRFHMTLLNPTATP